MKVVFVILSFSFIKKMENRFVSVVMHPRDRLPKTAPRINLEQGRCFISAEEFNGRIEKISRDLDRVKAFTSFTTNNHNKIKQRTLVSGDVKVFADLLDKEFINPKKMFESVCGQFQFEFLLMYDLSRE